MFKQSILVAAMFGAALIIGTTLFAVAPAHADVTPTLSVAATGNGDSVQINVYGDPNQSVILYYIKTGSGSQLTSIGTTDGNGNLSTTVSSATYGIASGVPVHVTVGGLNGPSSPTITWPTVTSTSTSSVTLSQTGLVLSVGQTSYVTATSTTGGTLYVANNSNPSVANVNVNGTQISFNGLTNGSTTTTICTVGNTTNCPSVYITVQNAGTAALSLSASTVTLSSGQSIPVTISGGNGSYTVTNNTGNGSVMTSLNGNILTLSTSMTTGFSSVTVCSTDMSACGIINVTVGSTSGSTVTFSQQTPVLSTGQSLTIAIYGNTSGSYYISSNTVPNSVEAGISQASLLLTGLTNGSSTITVCSSIGGCGTITATVNYASSGGNITLSQTTLSLLAGQNLAITVSGGVAPYSVATPSTSVYQATINGNILTVTGIGTGSAQIPVCSSSGGCTWLSLTVNGTSTGTTGTTLPASSLAPSFLGFSQSNPTVYAGQASTVTVTGGSGIYSVAYNSNPGAVSATVSGSSLYLTGVSNGVSIIVVCSALNNCGAVSANTGNVATVPYSAPVTATTATTVPVTTPSSALSFNFTSFLSVGSTGDQVLELQTILTARGYYSGPVNGNFGPLTQAAVEKYQSAHGIAAVGYVGPSTRAALNTTTN